MPDALSKTIPIWCTVMNRLLFPDDPAAHELHTPRQSVSEQEHHWIEKRLDACVEDAKKLELDLSTLRHGSKLPLRPLWITRDSLFPDEPPSFDDFHPIILCTASRQVLKAEMSEGGYIQGAGDDSEGWSNGLTPIVFWKHRDQLLETSESDLPSLIVKLQGEDRSTNSSSVFGVSPTEWLFIGNARSMSDAVIRDQDLVISCAEKNDSNLQVKLKARYYHLKCRHGKLGSRDLRKELQKLFPDLVVLPTTSKIYVSCETGRDLAVGAALAFLCQYADENGRLMTRSTQFPQKIDKDLIRHRLSWIMTSVSSASPSRATLQSVNEYLFIQEYLHRSRLPLTTNETPKPATSISKIFKSLEGEWKFHRDLTNHKRTTVGDPSTQSFSAGTVSGLATFTFTETVSGVEQNQYLYSENGVFKQDQGSEFPIHKDYLWKLEREKETAEETISIFFVKSDGKTEDYLYHTLIAKGTNDETVTATADHLCVKDLYQTTYVFERQHRFVVTHEVRGPAKDYTSTTRYSKDT
jgi:tRNA A64-2'-O-ribosylphosphate transferase